LSWSVLLVVWFPFILINIRDTLGWRSRFRGSACRFARCSGAPRGEAFNATTRAPPSPASRSSRADPSSRRLPRERRLARGGQDDHYDLAGTVSRLGLVVVRAPALTHGYSTRS